MRPAMRAFISRRWCKRASCQTPSRTHPAAMANEMTRNRTVERFQLPDVDFVIGGVHAPALLHLHPHAIATRLRECEGKGETTRELELVHLHCFPALHRLHV